MTSLVRVLVGVAVVVAACGAPVAQPSPAVAPTSEPTAVAPVAATAAPSPDRTSGPVVEPPAIALDPRHIPIVPLALIAPKVTAEIEVSLREAVEAYLQSLDQFRATGDGSFPVHGRFGDAVKAGLAASARPGTKRAFAVESMRVDRYLVKPWGTTALADVTVTIVDRVLEGSGQPERETGRLRLMGDRLHVHDGWNAAAGTWFNGIEALTEERIRMGVEAPLRFLLSHESWTEGSPVETRFSSQETPFTAARETYIGSFDRSKIRARTFADMTAEVERFEMISELDQGLATVRLRGTTVTVESPGGERREPFERRVVILFGNWAPEVVDEEVSAGVWRSGGDQALVELDTNRA